MRESFEMGLSSAQASQKMKLPKISQRGGGRSSGAVFKSIDVTASRKNNKLLDTPQGQTDYILHQNSSVSSFDRQTHDDMDQVIGTGGTSSMHGHA